jgi:hypothetical protein
MNHALEKYLDRTEHDFIEVLLQNLPLGAEENNEKSQNSPYLNPASLTINNQLVPRDYVA